jgi:hypothetical protein
MDSTEKLAKSFIGIMRLETVYVETALSKVPRPMPSMLEIPPNLE